MAGWQCSSVTGKWDPQYSSNHAAPYVGLGGSLAWQISLNKTIKALEKDSTGLDDEIKSWKSKKVRGPRRSMDVTYFEA